MNACDTENDAGVAVNGHSGNLRNPTATILVF